MKKDIKIINAKIDLLFAMLYGMPMFIGASNSNDIKRQWQKAVEHFCTMKNQYIELMDEDEPEKIS